jgi:hypothetical protein
LSTLAQIDRPGIQDSKPSNKINTRALKKFVLIAPLLLMSGFAAAQIQGMSAVVESHTSEIFFSTSAAIPTSTEIDAPQPQPAPDALALELLPGPGAVPMDQPGGYRVAPLHEKFILPGMRAQTLRVRDKVVIGLEDVYRPTNFGGIIVAAGYEQLRNGQPNYGTDRGALGERLGAAGIRDSAQGILTDAVFAPLLHEDPRYYVEGPQYGFFHRTVYAVTRPLITRTDTGRQAINGALLLGYASTSLLNNAYYPPVNRNVRDTAESFAGSIGGAAIGFVLTEFTATLWENLHLGHKH